MRRETNLSDGGVDAFLANHAPIQSRSVFRCGDLIGEWKIVAFLGRGGTSEVYRARSSTEPDDVAVKILMRDDESAKERFRREAKFMRHALPNAILPQFFGSGSAGGRPYIVMELLEPVEPPSNDRDAAKYMIEIADAVALLHKRSIVHRDLKPRNIMRRKDGRLAIIDLGLAHKPVAGGERLAGLRDSVSVHGGRVAAVGTPRFAAPEQFATDEISTAADIHALGVIADECFNSRPPGAWKKIIRRATSSLSAQRYRSAEDFANAVRLRNLPRRLCIAAATATFAVSAAIFLFASDAGARMRESFFANAILSSAASEQGFALDGATITLSRPLCLEVGKGYAITGPGTLIADIRSEDGATLTLKDCVIRNTTQIAYPQNATRYVLISGTYLNFANHDEPAQFSRRDYITLLDGASNEVRFRGPATIQELKEEKTRTFLNSIKSRGLYSLP